MAPPSALLPARPRPRSRSARTSTAPASLEALAALDDTTAMLSVVRGLPARLLRQLAGRLDLSIEQLAGPLQLTPRTLLRRLQEGTLAQPESERLLAITRLFFQTACVLDGETKAAHWLQSPLPVLAGKTPLDCMTTWLGIQQVQATLWRIEDGVIA